MTRRKEINKQRRKKLKNFRRTLSIVYDSNLDEHYRPILFLPNLIEETPLSAFARK